MKNIIVTGANGFIGSNLVKKLISSGCKVCAVVKQNKSNLEDIQSERLKIVQCPLQHIHLLSTLIEGNWEVFYHLAWQGVSNIQAQDYKIQLDNIRYACEAVVIAASLGVKKFIFASSIMEYEVEKLMETSIDAGMRNIYSTSKMAATYMTRILANNKKIGYCSAIISNVYGPREFSNRFIISTLRNMVDGKMMVFSSGTQMYDFIYIDDACNILYEIGKYGKNNKRYYVGNNEIIPLKDFIYRMRDVANPDYEICLGGGEYVGVSLNYSEFKTLNYDDVTNIKFTAFEDGIQNTVNWIKEMQGYKNSDTRGE